MRRICYFTIENPSNDGAGVEYKIYRQMQELRKHGYDVVYCKYDLNRKGFHKLSSNLSLLNKEYNQEIVNKIASCDAVYMRYFLLDFNVIDIIKKIKKNKPSIKILIEIPTYPYDKEFPAGSFSLTLDKINRKRLYKYVDNIITFSDDKNIWGIPAITISNGVDIEKISPRKFENHSSEIHAIAVAKLAFWHGYDRLIEGLHEYYKENTNKDIFVVHIVGDGDVSFINNLKRKAEEYGLQKYIRFHGRLVGDDLSNVYSQCSLAFDSLGRHRCGIYYNSTLKGKEYLAKGLPIISGVKTELDDVSIFPYYLRVPSDESPINISSIVDFYHSVYDNESVEIVSDIIRNFCIANFSFDNVFSKVIDIYDGFFKKTNN